MPSSELETDPCLQDTWLTRLAPEEQAALRRRWNQRAAELAASARREQRRALLDYAFIALVFGLGDLVHGWDGPMSFFTALGVGSFLGGLILVLEANRTLAALIGGLGLFLHQWLVRGGLSWTEAGMMAPLVVVLWLLGRRRA